MSDQRMLSLRLHREDDHFWAEVEEMPGVFATGDDLEELREALAEAISLYLATSDQERVVVHLEFVPPPDMKRVSVRAELVPC